MRWSATNATCYPASAVSATDKYRLYASGQQAIDGFLTAQRDYNETLRQYWEALTRHRRGMLELNSAVGQRLLP